MSAVPASKPAERRPRTEIALADIENPIVRKSLDVWERLRADRQMPARADMSPRALLGVLANTALLRVIDGGDEFEFRIVGDQIAVQQGMVLQGKKMAEIDAILPGYGALLKRIYRDGFDARKPLAFRGWYTRPMDNHPFFHEVVLLPVGEDGETVDHLFVVAA